MDRKEYSSYDEARLAYNIPDGDIYLKITNHQKSLNKILQCRNVIYYIGEGHKKYPGYPSGNQMYYRQLPLLKKLKYDYYVHAFNKIGDNRIVYLGLYSLMSYKKKESFEGFTYFEIKMKRKCTSY
jgi:hypothetical protein